MHKITFQKVVGLNLTTPTYQGIFLASEGVLFHYSLTSRTYLPSDPLPAAVFRDPLKRQRHLETNLPVQQAAVRPDFSDKVFNLG